MAAYGTGYYGRGVYGIGNVVISGNAATGAVGNLLETISIQENGNIATGNVGTVGTLYFDEDIREVFYVGQSVTITNSGTKYNGTKTVKVTKAKAAKPSIDAIKARAKTAEAA